MSLQEERHEITCSGIWCEMRKNIKKKKIGDEMFANECEMR